MPLITAKFYEGRLNAQTEPKLVEALTDALVSVFGPEIREQTWVVLEEFRGGDGVLAVVHPEHSSAPRPCAGQLRVIPRPNGSDLTEQFFGRLDVRPNEAEKLGGFASVANPVIVGQRQGYHRSRDD